LGNIISCPDDGGSKSLRRALFQTTRLGIPENGSLHGHQKDCLGLHKNHFAFEFYDAL